MPAPTRTADSPSPLLVIQSIVFWWYWCARFYSYCRQPLPLCRETFTWQKSVTAPPVNHPLPTLCDCSSFKLDFQNEYLVCVDVDNKTQSFELCACLCALLFGSIAFITFRRLWCTVALQKPAAVREGYCSEGTAVRGTAEAVRWQFGLYEADRRR